MKIDYVDGRPTTNDPSNPNPPPTKISLIAIMLELATLHRR